MVLPVLLRKLSRIMAEDLRDSGVAVNIFLPGGAVRTGMIPPEALAQPDVQSSLLDPQIMACPISFLASPQAEGITGERIEALHFDSWLNERGLHFEEGETR